MPPWYSLVTVFDFACHMDQVLCYLYALKEKSIVKYRRYNVKTNMTQRTLYFYFAFLTTQQDGQHIQELCEHVFENIFNDF